MWFRIVSKCHARTAIILLVALFTTPPICDALDTDRIHFPPNSEFLNNLNNFPLKKTQTALSHNPHENNNIRGHTYEEETNKELIFNVSKSITGLGLKFLKKIQSTENFVISPFSIATSLALIQQGALGTTRQQISKLLGMHRESGAIGFNKLYDTINQRRSNNILKVASAIFAHNSSTDHFTIKPKFQYQALNNFNTSVYYDANFDYAERAAKVVNKWVSKQTDGFIQELITADSVSEHTRMVLANAIFFKGKWKDPFDPSNTDDMNFNLASGQAKSTKFMHSMGKYRAGTFRKIDNGATFLILPFEGEKYSFMGILPGKKSNLDTLISNLNTTILLDKLTKLRVKDVKVTMPKFVIQKQYNLEKILPQMGLTELFSERCNISNIGHYNGVTPSISSAMHSAALIVDEKGSTAAAATAYGVTTLSVDDSTVYFWADRPFLAILWDAENSVPLFMARIEDPSVL